MNIKKVSEETGISADTIRYYERIGLIPPVTRNQSGIRDFSEREIAILKFVRYFRRVGLSVDSLIAYIGLMDKGDETIPARIAIFQEERAKLQERIDQLQEALTRLDYKIENYENKVLPRERELFEDKEESK
ncbi:stress response transcriptional regulator NmlR [Streptococcus massiliensis]|uniref:MerR family regulatory protein n=1 Tax=Streptococcus massiliensis TaxID=313439 RepID=A0A380KZH5_9STRE|nr:stress response transcriptional regulator NmlR [Streptococcus massiliensis]SUN77148.1 MerR family regulatory protein [Streptococcus massiliensis]